MSTKERRRGGVPGSGRAQAGVHGLVYKVDDRAHLDRLCTIIVTTMSDDDRLERLRKICLAFPEATEQETWGHPTFRVRDKIFAACGSGEEGLSMTCKAPSGAQEVLVAADPGRFFRPAYVGHRGWIGVRLDLPVDWDQIADLVEESYRMTAPKRLSAGLDSSFKATAPVQSVRQL